MALKSKPEDKAVDPKATQGSAAQGSATGLGFWQQQRQNIRLVAIALLIAVVLRVWVAEPRFIPSNSMDPTLHIGDRLLVEKISYHLHPPALGDIVVFHPPETLQSWGYDPKQAFIKRVVGEPGDTLAVYDGHLYRNGKPQTETYLAAAPAYQMSSFTVPPGHIFVMGDNRNDSNDSHVWGPLPVENVIGHAQFRFWPVSHFGPLG